MAYLYAVVDVASTPAIQTQRHHLFANSDDLSGGICGDFDSTPPLVLLQSVLRQVHIVRKKWRSLWATHPKKRDQELSVAPEQAGQDPL